MHKAHLSAGGAKSAVGKATAGRCKKLSGDEELPLREQWILNGQTRHPTDTSDPCQRPMQTDRHGQPTVGVSSCPVGDFGVGVAAYIITGKRQPNGQRWLLDDQSYALLKPMACYSGSVELSTSSNQITISEILV